MLNPSVGRLGIREGRKDEFLGFLAATMRNQDEEERKAGRGMLRKGRGRSHVRRDVMYTPSR